MARIDLAYPKITGTKNFPAKNCIGFYKYDGSNISFCWSKNKGFYAFGTRKTRFDLTSEGIEDFNAAHPGLEEVFPTFDSKFKTIQNHNGLSEYDNLIFFTEFLGDSSFAGQHKPGEPKKLILFDVQTEKGFVPPEEFIKCFDSITDIASVFYEGKYTGQLVNDIRNGKYNLHEGAILKAYKNDVIYMAKVKTNAYMEKLKTSFKNDWINYWE